MKKLILLFAICICSFSQEKKYKIELTAEQVGVLWKIIDNSNYPHTQVKVIQDLIDVQLKAQIDTAKKK